jgi:hypothetical protein
MFFVVGRLDPGATLDLCTNVTGSMQEEAAAQLDKAFRVALSTAAAGTGRAG